MKETDLEIFAAFKLEPFVTRYAAGRISHKDFVNGMYRVQGEVDEYSKKPERAFIAKKFAEGEDKLGTDQCGYRTLAQMRERPFFSGNASNCLALGIFDPDLLILICTILTIYEPSLTRKQNQKRLRIY